MDYISTINEQIDKLICLQKSELNGLVKLQYAEAIARLTEKAYYLSNKK